MFSGKPIEGLKIKTQEEIDIETREVKLAKLQKELEKEQDKFEKENVVTLFNGDCKLSNIKSIDITFTDVTSEDSALAAIAYIRPYVNGYLIFISRDLTSFNFKALNDVPEKQEGVAYNISLGGGSLGLLETILPDYYTELNQILPIEKDFCGTFIGDIKSFKMYEGFID